MSKQSNWLSGSREAILEKADVWIPVCTDKRTAWGIASVALTELTAHRDAARAARAVIKDDNTRTPVAVAKCNEAFDALKDFMKDFKRRYFIKPPLTDADFISLGLKPRDTHPTPSGKPTAHVMVEVYLAGQNQLGVRIVYVSGNPDDPANKSYRIAYLVVGPGETPPTDPEELRNSFSTHRKKELIEFPFGDSGKRVYFCVRIENGRKVGGWGPIVSAVIP
jgi:hypothetical protein